METHAPSLQVMDFVGPALAAAAFVAIMSRVREPARRSLNAILVGGASGAYIGAAFGPWELVYPVLGIAVAYLGLRAHPWIGVGWLLHAVWDLAHHLMGSPILPFMPTSSFGCLLFDSLIATWFLAGAPTASIRAALSRA